MVSRITPLQTKQQKQTLVFENFLSYVTLDTVLSYQFCSWERKQIFVNVFTG